MTFIPFNQSLWVNLKLYKLVWRFYGGKWKIFRWQKEVKMVPNISPKRKLLHVPMPKIFDPVYIKTKILLLTFLLLISCLIRCICWSLRCIKNFQSLILGFINLLLFIPSICLLGDSCPLNFNLPIFFL